MSETTNTEESRIPPSEEAQTTPQQPIADTADTPATDIEKATEITAETAEKPKAKKFKKPTKKQVKEGIVSYLLMTVGTILLASGVYFFKAPNHFATGGVSGISIILAKYIPHFKQSYFVMIINVALLILGFIFLGKGCTVRTIYCSLMYSAENLLLEEFLPIDLIPGAFKNADGVFTLTDQPLMELVYAMLLTGIGSAIIFNCKGSSGGTDIVALVLKKYTKLNTGKALLITDAIIACCAFVFGPRAGLFSVLGLFSKAFIIDGVIENIGKSKYITIITTAPEQIGDYILNQMKRDFTSYKAQGGYTGAEKTVLITVCKRGEALKLKYMAKKMDANSFIIITDANEILGKGFREAP